MAVCLWFRFNILKHVTMPSLSLVVHNQNMTYSSHKQFRVMQKLMGKSKKKRGWYEENDAKKAAKAYMPLPTDIHKGNRSSKRVTILNKLFMKHITDLMATGQNSTQLLGHGIGVSRVKVASEFNVLNVYWVSKGETKESDVSALLQRTAGELRNELSTLRVMGQVPEIKFVKDRSSGTWVEVDNLLKVADFGEDYCPSELGNLLKEEFSMEMTLPDSLVKNIQALEEIDEVPEEPLPLPRQNVLGLNHAEIINRIAALTEKARAVHRFTDTREGTEQREEKQTVEREQPRNQDVVEFDKAKFQEYLHKREVTRKKLLRTEKEYLLNEERFRLVKDDDPGVEGDRLEEEDFLDEFEDEQSRH